MDIIVYLLSFIAIALGTFEFFVDWLPLICLFAAAVTVFYIKRGRWQASLFVLFFLGMALYSGLGHEAVLSTTACLTLGVISTFCYYFLWASPIPNCPKPSGQYPVGIRSIEYEKGDTRRHFYCWYPAQATQKTRPYFTTRENEAFKSIFKVLKAPTFLGNHFTLASTNSAEDVQVSEGSFPLVIFHHGGGLHPLQNFSLMEELASNGYIVCSISHPGSSAGVVWADGSITEVKEESLAYVKDSEKSQEDMARYMLLEEGAEKRALLEKILEAHQSSLSATTIEWAHDGIAVVDMLLSDEPIVSCLDISSALDKEKLAYMGMSLGGSAASESCYIDDRASAGINLDGLFWNPNRIGEAITIPFMQCYNDPTLSLETIQKTAGVDSQECPDFTHLYNDYFYRENGENALVQTVIFKGITHMGFTDQVLSSRGKFSILSGLGSNANPASAQALAKLCLSFLDENIRAKNLGEFDKTIKSSDIMDLQSVN